MRAIVTLIFVTSLFLRILACNSVLETPETTCTVFAAAATAASWDAPSATIETGNQVFLNTQNYIWQNYNGDSVYVDAADPTYTLKNLETPIYYYPEISGTFDQMRVATVGETEMIVAIERNGNFHSVPLGTTEKLGEPKTITYNNSGEQTTTAGLDVHNDVAVAVTALSQANSINFTFRMIKLAEDLIHNNYESTRPTEGVPTETTYTALPDTMTALATTNYGDSVYVFTPGYHGINVYNGSISSTLSPTDITTGTDLAKVSQCLHMTRISISETFNNSGTVTLAVACADDGESVSKPAVYIVQVDISYGVPQPLKVLAKATLDQADAPSTEAETAVYGGMAYLDGSLVLATSHYVYNFMISEPESEFESPTLTLRSWFASPAHTLTNATLLTPALAVVGTVHLPTAGNTLPAYTSAVVLNVATGEVVQGVTTTTTDVESLHEAQLSGHYMNVQSVTRLSDTSFITAGGNGAIRRWESCAGLGHDYTTVELDGTAPAATCSCPEGKACLLGTAYNTDACPANTNLVGAKCLPNDGLYTDRVNLGLLTCPIAHMCAEGVKTACTGNTYQPQDGQGECWTCPTNSTANADHTTCTVNNGYFISGGSFAGNDATIAPCPAGHTCTNNTQTPCTGANYTANEAGDYVTEAGAKCLTCPAGYKCTDGVQTACTGAEYQPAEGETTCLACAAGSIVNTEHTTCTLPANNSSTIVIVVVVVIVVVLVVAAVVVVLLRRRARAQANANFGANRPAAGAPAGKAAVKVNPAEMNQL